jgi:hypothetical protein
MAQTPCRNYRLEDNSSASIPESLLSLSRARRSRARMTMRPIPSWSRPRHSSTESMTQLPLLQSRSHACLQAAVLLVARGDFVVWPFESSRAFRLLRLYQQPPSWYAFISQRSVPNNTLRRAPRVPRFQHVVCALPCSKL